jgi:hypothetical protein
MAGTTTCRTCGQANADGTEYCVRCGERMPDPSSTQLVNAGSGAEQEYPWEPPAEWDPGELPPTIGQQQTWVGRGADQVGWNTGHDAGAGSPWNAQGGQSGGQYQQTPPPPPPPIPSGGNRGSQPGGSKKPVFIGAGVVVIIAAIVAVVLVATGGKKANTAKLNGVQNQSGTDALTSARVALRDAKSVHLAGTVRNSGQIIRLDLTLVGSDSQGTLTINNNDVQLIKVGDTVFIKGDQDFLKQYTSGNAAVLDQLNGKWLKTPSTSDFDLFSIDGFANLLKGGTGSSTVNAQVTQSTLNGKPIVVIAQSDGSKLSVANTGPPFPLVIDAKGDSGGQLTFGNYNAGASITAPDSSNVLDVSTLGTLPGAYTCKAGSGGGGGTLTLLADKSYTLSGGSQGGSWGSSSNQVAFAGGNLDKYAATWNGTNTLDLKGSGTNSAVSFTCVKQ